MVALPCLQVQTMATGDVFITPHGSHMINLIFAPEARWYALPWTAASRDFYTFIRCESCIRLLKALLVTAMSLSAVAALSRCLLLMLTLMFYPEKQLTACR